MKPKTHNFIVDTVQNAVHHLDSSLDSQKVGKLIATGSTTIGGIWLSTFEAIGIIAQSVAAICAAVIGIVTIWKIIKGSKKANKEKE